MPSDNRIRILDQETQRKIAAGEVIVCATGVVKELMENSIDAGCTAIEITLDACKIIVADNGYGILHDDLEILCNRFTTSKITKYDDLLSIGSFGFRGEALSAVSCVSKVSIQTKHTSQNLGYVCDYTDYKLISCVPKAMNIGTTIIVSDLFYNLPNRQAGLRSFQAEINACLRMVQSYSIEYPEIKFVLRKGINRTKSPIYTSPSSSRFQRITSISKIDNFIALYHSNTTHAEDAQVDCSQFPPLDSPDLLKSVLFIASHPHVSLSDANPPFILFINNRLVKSQIFKKLCLGFFETYLPKGKLPFCFLSLQLKPQIIDVNVHPSKKEIIISCESAILDALSALLEQKIKRVDQSRPFQVKVMDSQSTLSLTTNSLSLEQPEGSMTTANDDMDTDMRSNVTESTQVSPKRDFKDLIAKYSNKKQRIIPPSQLRRTTSRDLKLTSFYSNVSQSRTALSQSINLAPEAPEAPAKLSSTSIFPISNKNQIVLQQKIRFLN